MTLEKASFDLGRAEGEAEGGEAEGKAEGEEEKETPRELLCAKDSFCFKTGVALFQVLLSPPNIDVVGAIWSRFTSAIPPTPFRLGSPSTSVHRSSLFGLPLERSKFRMR